jgi:hypothetical protein
MKSILGIIMMMFFLGHLAAQKNPTIQASNLNLSKSNINKLIYPPNTLTEVKAQALLMELEKNNLPDETAMKTWLAANFKRFGVVPDQIKQIFIFSGRQYEDCTICKKNCTGRCVQDPGSDCVCVSHSEPNLRTVQTGKAVKLIYLSAESMEEATAMELVSDAIVSAKRATTVKSGKSNSSD